MPDLASAQVAAPADGARSRGRVATPNGSPDQTADADFGKHLASMTVGDDRAGPPTASREERKPSGTRWRPWGDANKLPVLDPDRAGDEEAAAAQGCSIVEDGKGAAAAAPGGAILVDAGVAMGAACSTALPPVAAATPAKPPPTAGEGIRPAAVTPLAALVEAAELPRAHDVASRGGESSSARSIGMAMAGPARFAAQDVAKDAAGLVLSPAQGARRDAGGPGRSPAQGIGMDAAGPVRPVAPSIRSDAAAPVQEISIVRRETHLPPSMPVTARPVPGRGVAQTEGSADAPVPADGAGAPDTKAMPAAPYPTVAVARGKDGGQWLANASPGRPPATPAGSQAIASTSTAESGSATRAAPAEEGVRDVPHATRGAGPAGRESQPVPQAPFSPVRQIADRIAADVLASGSGQAPADPVSSLPSAPTAQLPLKVLTIQLHPAELGTVTVRIAIKNDALELQIEAGRRDTARLVDADRETLSSLLRSAGYSVEALTVRAVDPSSAPASVGSSHGSSDGAAQSQAGGSQPDARPSGGRTHAGEDGSLHGPRRDSNDEQDGSRYRAGDGLYV